MSDPTLRARLEEWFGVWGDVPSQHGKAAAFNEALLLLHELRATLSALEADSEHWHSHYDAVMAQWQQEQGRSAALEAERDKLKAERDEAMQLVKHARDVSLEAAGRTNRAEAEIARLRAALTTALMESTDSREAHWAVIARSALTPSPEDGPCPTK